MGLQLYPKWWGDPLLARHSPGLARLLAATSSPTMSRVGNTTPCSSKRATMDSQSPCGTSDGHLEQAG